MQTHAIRWQRRKLALSPSSDDWENGMEFTGSEESGTRIRMQYTLDAGKTCSDVLGVVAQTQIYTFIGVAAHRRWSAVKKIQEVSKPPVHTSKLACRCGFIEYVKMTRATHWNERPRVRLVTTVTSAQIICTRLKHLCAYQATAL
jgi:hypothetical protein